MTSHQHYNIEAALLCASADPDVPPTVRDIVSAADTVVWEVERPACIWDDVDPPPTAYELVSARLSCGDEDDIVIPADMAPTDVQQLAALIVCRTCADWHQCIVA